MVPAGKDNWSSLGRGRQIQNASDTDPNFVDISTWLEESGTQINVSIDTILF